MRAPLGLGDRPSWSFLALAGGIGGALLGNRFVPSYIPDNRALFVIGGMWIGVAEGAMTGMFVNQLFEPKVAPSASDGSQLPLGAYAQRPRLSFQLKAAFFGSLPGIVEERRLAPLGAFGLLMGLSIIIPLLPLFAARFGATPFIIGILQAAYPMMQFVGTPILGGLSDRYGRKPILLFSQLGTFAGFVLLGFATMGTVLGLAALSLAVLVMSTLTV